MTRVTVALLGARKYAWDEKSIVDASDHQLTWDTREKVELEVAQDETLGHALRRAGELLDLEVPWGDGGAPSVVAFYEPSHDTPGRVGYSHTMTVLDDDGRARWKVPYEGVTFAEAERARDAKALAGDPHRLYYSVYPGVGNGVIAPWAIILAAYAVMQVISTIEGAVAFGERVLDAVRQRIGPGREVIEANALKWEQRGGDQIAVRHMLGDRLWHPADAAHLLGCTDSEAEAVLWTLGYAKDDDLGLWRHEGDEAAKILDTALHEADLSYNLGHSDWKRTYEERTEHFLKTGKRAPMKDIDAEEYADYKLVPKDTYDAETEDFDEDELGDDERLPLNDLLVKCSCGKEGCTAIGAFGIANGRLKFGFSGPTDHFVVEPNFMTNVAMQIALDIDAAKPNGD